MSAVLNEVPVDGADAKKAEKIAHENNKLHKRLCRLVVQAMLAHPNVRAARVSTMKPDVYPDCEGVGVEVFQIKDEA